jgi:serine/threonine protein kinase
MPSSSIDHRVDIWALGAILYECLAGIRPIEGETLDDVLDALMDTAITPLSALALALPAEVTDIAHRMLSRNPEQRPTLHAVTDVLGRYTAAHSLTFGFPNSELGLQRDADVEEDEEPAPMGRRGHTL